MATAYRIHPAIGIARVGNSPEFFIGPERIGQIPEPQGGFKDAQYRVKRQAARFRIFAHLDDGTAHEVTDAEAEIRWTVHVANKKASYPGRNNTTPASLEIDPGPRTIDGPNQQRLFDSGAIQFNGDGSPTTVPLGEIRTDDQNRLLVLGGDGRAHSPGLAPIVDFWGNPGWYDDIADGPVSATVRMRGSGETPAVTGAWVITTPPKFSPHQDSITTLYDRVLDAMVAAGLLPVPNSTSYTRDIYPILKRVRDINWVKNTHQHAWTDPVVSQAQRSAIFARLRPAGNMPTLNNDDSRLTDVQLAHMQRWKDGNFANDWNGEPVPEANVSPAGLDRSALEACVGGGFYPGIEAGGKSSGNRPIVEAAFYADAFRINQATVGAGSISASMAQPWQADFFDCQVNWWPVPRPDDVIPQGTSTYKRWDRGIGDKDEMVKYWHTLGFVVRQGAKHVETERQDTPSITLLTPELNFRDVPQGPMGMVREQPLAITFEVISATALTLEFAPGGAPTGTQLVVNNHSITVGPTGTSVATAKLWVIYRTGMAPSTLAPQTVRIREPASGQTWSVIITGNTVARKTAAVALVLDRSGSMSEDRGDGETKHASLQQAAEIFVDVMLEGDGVGLVRYDNDAQVIQPIARLGSGGISDLARSTTIDLIRGNSFDPAGGTSIGDGIYQGRQILASPSGSYDSRVLTVLTDGNENESRFIADVAPEIDEKTYAIGLGRPENTSAAALQALSGNNGGYLLITGAIDTNNRFALQKHFLQILGSVSNAEVVLDPDGYLETGAVHKIPFTLCDADSGVDVIIVSPAARSIDFRIQAPSGRLLEPWQAMTDPAMRFVLSPGVSYYRFVLPLQLEPDRFDQEGTWNVIITPGAPRMERSGGNDRGVDLEILYRGTKPEHTAHHPSDLSVLTEEQRSYVIGQEAGQFRPSDSGETKSAAATRGGVIPYSVIVHAYSNVSMTIESKQSSYEPNADIYIHAFLTQSGLPMEEDATVWADVQAPGYAFNFALTKVGTGEYQGTVRTEATGLYRLRVRAHGYTRSGLPFTRERMVSAAVWRGGDQPPPISYKSERSADGERGATLAEGEDAGLVGLMTCLFIDDVIQPDLEKRLRKLGFDLEAARKCLNAWAAQRGKDRS